MNCASFRCVCSAAAFALNAVCLQSAHGDSLARMAEALRYPTVSYQNREQIDYRQFDAFLSFLQRSYPKTFARLEIETFSQFSLLLTWRGSDASLAPVLLDAHYDVVPIEPGTLDDWPHPPFAGKLADGYLWGRGVIDDKLAVIAYFEALERLLSQDFAPARTLYISIVHDEEIGGHQGAAVIAAALKARGISFPYMVGEGGGLIEQTPWLAERPMAMIALAEKTYVTLTLSVSGEGGHSSMPPPDNAIARLAKAVVKVHENPLPPQLRPPITEMLAVLGGEVGGTRGWLMQNLWLGRPLVLNALMENPANNAMVRSTSALTMFNGGVKENVIPQRAEAKVNMRLLPGVTIDEAVRAIRKIVDDSGIEISVDSWGQSPPVATVDGDGYARISAAIEKVFPDTLIVPGLLVASTDTRHYSIISKEIYRFRPFRLPLADAPRIHATGERLAARSVAESVAYAEALMKSITAP
ncbi:MAG: M20/M25/M40 family metallo-hydrolase [Pseudomonadales bacterium]